MVLAFLSQNFGKVMGPMNSTCHFVNVDGLVVLLLHGGDTSTLDAVIKLVSTFCTQRFWGPWKPSLDWFPTLCGKVLHGKVLLVVKVSPGCINGQWALDVLCPWTYSGQFALDAFKNTLPETCLLVTLVWFSIHLHCWNPISLLCTAMSFTAFTNVSTVFSGSAHTFQGIHNICRCIHMIHSCHWWATWWNFHYLTFHLGVFLDYCIGENLIKWIWPCISLS